MVWALPLPENTPKGISLQNPDSEKESRRELLQSDGPDNGCDQQPPLKNNPEGSCYRAMDRIMVAISNHL